jgi:hypothetical protein
VRVHGLDEVNLFATAPSFDFLLPKDRGVGIDEFLVINETVKVIAAGEAGNEFVLVLEYAMRQVASDPRV